MGRAPKQSWITKSTYEATPWGECKSWNTLRGISGKMIKIHEGKRTSLKFHRIRSEVFFILSGVVSVDFGSSKTVSAPEKYPMQSKVLRAGDVLNVQSECPYRLTALEDCTIIVVGDKDECDPVRIEDDYGRSNVDKP